MNLDFNFKNFILCDVTTHSYTYNSNFGCRPILLSMLK